MKVLIIDDSPIVRTRIITMLNDIEGINVIGAVEDAQKGLVMFLKHQPDVVILDIRMPGMTGIEVLINIKNENPSTTVIMLTNYPYPQYRMRCIKAGADYFFDKTNEFDKVVGVILKMKGINIPAEKGKSVKKK